MRVTHIVSEAVPFTKTGGLADVAGALPKAQGQLGLEVTVILPAHRQTLREAPPGKPLQKLEIMGLAGQVYELEQEGVRWLFVDCPPLFVRPALYSLPEGDFPDNPMRFASFCRLACQLSQGSDVLHVHDWQTALVPFLLAQETPAAKGKPVTVLTIHNLAYQGLFPPWVLEACSLPKGSFTIEGLEFYGKVSFLKGGLVAATAITTVSPTYAREILTPAFGCGLEGVLAARKDRLFGILNGLDQDLWDPSRDSHLPLPYNRENLTPGKKAAAALLRQELGMESSSRPLLGMVSRLTEQKGADVVVAALEDILQLGFDLAVLGTGEARFEELLRAAQAARPDRVGVACRFDDRLARLIYAGSAFFLMPSRWEPCGLGQMIALRYGTLPVVHATGGLADTVRPIHEPEGNGFPFAPLSPQTLVEALAQARELWQKPDVLLPLQQRAMAQDFSWSRSAKAYAELYQRLLSG
jgi:starch synthase